MVKKITKNKIIIFIVCILAVFGIIEFIQYCLSWNHTIEVAREMQASYPDLQIDYTKKDTFNVFMDLMMNSHLNIIQLILPILVMIPGIFHLFELLKSGIFKDCIMRKNYKKMITKEIGKAYLPALIVPLFLVFMFILSYLFSNSFNIQYTYEHILGETMNFPVEYMKIPMLFIIIYIVNIAMVSIFFINVALLFINRNKNFLLTILFSFLTIMAYQIISEVFLGFILSKIFNNHLFENLFSLYNLWVYDGTNLFAVTAYVLLLTLFSTFLVFRHYKNHEKVVIANEK